MVVFFKTCLGRLLSINLNKTLDLESMRVAVLMNQIAILFVWVSISFMSVLTYLGYSDLAMLAFPFVLSYMSCLIFNKQGYYQISKGVLIFSSVILIVIYAVLLGESSGIHYMTIILSAFMVVLCDQQRKWARFFAFIFPMALFFWIQYHLFDWYPTPKLLPEHASMMYVIIVSTLFVLIYLISQFYVGVPNVCKDKNRALPAVYGVTSRETEIVLKISQGFSNKEIAKDLFIEEGTVKNYLTSIYRKINVKNRLELLALLNREVS